MGFQPLDAGFAAFIDEKWAGEFFIGVTGVRLEHKASPDCWCRPVPEPVLRADGEYGVIWIHNDRKMD